MGGVFFEFLMGGILFLIIFSKVFARLPLITARDNRTIKQKYRKIHKSTKTQNYELKKGVLVFLRHVGIVASDN